MSGNLTAIACIAIEVHDHYHGALSIQNKSYEQKNLNFDNPFSVTVKRFLATRLNEVHQ